MVFSLQCSWFLKTLSCSSLGYASCVGHSIIIYPWLYPHCPLLQAWSSQLKAGHEPQLPLWMEAMQGTRVVGFTENLRVMPISQKHHTENFIPLLSKIAVVNAWLSKTLEASPSLILDNSSCFLGIIQERKERTKVQNYKFHSTMHGTLELQHFWHP